MADLFKELTAPNGLKYTQPLGLFINNEFVKSSNNETLDVLNPAYVPCICIPSHLSGKHKSYTNDV